MTKQMPLRLAFVTKTMSLPGGGAERVLATVASGLARRGHTVTLISRDPPSSEDYYAAPGVDRLRQGGLAESSTSCRAFALADWLTHLRHTLEQRQPDVVIGFMHSSYLPLGVVLRGARFPLLASEHTVYAHYHSRPVERLLLRFTPWLVDQMTVVSEQARDSFPPALRKQMVVVPNPVDHVREANAPISRRLVIAAVGRLDKAKDHATLISAFARVADAHPEWSLEIAGEGDRRAQLATQIAQLQLSSRVRLLGVVQDIPALLRRASVFAMASRYESFGLATAEALMLGVPAIGFADCAGTNELIVNGLNGVLVQPEGDRVGALAKALSAMLSDEKMRDDLAANGPASVAQYETEAVLDKWEDVLRGMVREQQT